MQLPKTRRKPKIREKKCSYAGCEKTFYGIHAAKYCEDHRDPKSRIKDKPAVEDVSEKNHVFEHKFNEVKSMILKCALEGCGKEFEIKVYPKQFVYPKYCTEHRNEHKRQKFMMTLKEHEKIAS